MEAGSSPSSRSPANYPLFPRTSPDPSSFSGGNAQNPEISPGGVDPFHYKLGILIMAIVTGAYVILGLRAVIVTGVIQSVLLLWPGFWSPILLFATRDRGLGNRSSGTWEGGSGAPAPL